MQRLQSRFSQELNTLVGFKDTDLVLIGSGRFHDGWFPPVRPLTGRLHPSLEKPLWPHQPRRWPTPGLDSRKRRAHAPSSPVETTQRGSNGSLTGFLSLSKCESKVVSLAEAASGSSSALLHSLLPGCFLSLKLREESVAKA